MSPVLMERTSQRKPHRRSYLAPPPPLGGEEPCGSRHAAVRLSRSPGRRGPRFSLTVDITVDVGSGGRSLAVTAVGTPSPQPAPRLSRVSTGHLPFGLELMQLTQADATDAG